VAEQRVEQLLAERVDTAVGAYLDEHLEALVGRLVERRLAAFEPPEINTNTLRRQVVKQVNSDLENFVRQLNQRTVAGLIEKSVYEQINEVANDFAQRLRDSEKQILKQVPDKNEMVDHIRVVTEGSLEGQVRETATYVAEEIANSVATETVENLLDQHLAHQSLTEQNSKSSTGRIVALLALAAVGMGAYIYFLI
jgi:uncharacterized membrane-anchored protein YjiN (DUF445 family)